MCNEWCDEFYPKIKDMLPALSKDGIKVFHDSWKTPWTRTSGHAAIRIQVNDDPLCQGKGKSFAFYLDDGWKGGPDHVFVDAEIDPKWDRRIDLIMTGQETLEQLRLNPPIGPGEPPQPPFWVRTLVGVIQTFGPSFPFQP
jgi:hypothetical protein